MAAGRDGAVLADALQLGIQPAEDAGRGEQLRRGVRDPFLDQLHVHDRFAISNEHAINREVELPDQAAEFARAAAQAGALHRHARHFHRCAEPALARAPRLHPIRAPRFQHGVEHLLELHARPAHPDQRDEGSEHFIAALADLVDARVAQHALERGVVEIRSAAVDLEGVVHRFPQTLGREDLQHRRLHHVVFEPAVDQRRGHRRHRFHGVNIGRHPADFFLHQIELAQRFLELPPRIRVCDRELQARFRATGATRAKSGPSEVQHRQRHLQAFAQLAEHVLHRHLHVFHGEASGRRPANSQLRHARFQHREARHVWRHEERRDRGLVGARHRRARHHRQHLRDRRVRDVALLAIQNKMRAVRARCRSRLHVGCVGAGLFFREREGGQLFAAHERWEPFLLLLLGAEQEQRPDADRVMRIGEDRRGRATAAEFFQYFAVGHLGEAAPAKLLWRRHPEDARSRQAIDHVLRNVRNAIDLGWIQFRIKKLTHFGERLVEVFLLRGRWTRIWHRPIRHELSQKKPLGEAERLRPGEKQLLRFLDFFLSPNLCFVHKVTLVLQGLERRPVPGKPAVDKSWILARLTTGNLGDRLPGSFANRHPEPRRRSRDHPAAARST